MDRLYWRPEWQGTPDDAFLARLEQALAEAGEGWVLDGCNLDQWRSLKRKGVIKSRNGGPYVVNRDGLSRLRSQLDNRVSGRGA